MKRILLIIGVLANVLLANAQGIITPPTEGVTVEHYSAGAFFESNNDFEWQDGYYVTFVYSNTTNDVWVSNMFQDMLMDATANDIYVGTYAWLHGTKNGNRITFAKEKVYSAYGENYIDKDLYLVAVKVDNFGNETPQASFDMVIDADGNIKVDNDDYICLLELDANGKPYSNENGIQAEDYALCHEFVHLSDKDLTYPTIPSNVEMKDYSYTTTLYSLGDREKTAQMGFDGNDVYVKGMAAVQGFTSDVDWVFPDVVFTGKLSDDGQSFTMADRQFYGIYDYLGLYYVTYLFGAKMSNDGAADTVITFVKDGDSWKLQDGMYLCRASIVPETIYALESNVTLAYIDPAGISQVENGQQKSPAAMFNIAGQKVAPSAKGIIIKNGKKFVK